MSRFFQALFFILFISSFSFAKLTLTDKGYFQTPGLSVLVFSNAYPEGHQGGLEIILHEQRLATNGDLRLGLSPGQWDPLPTVSNRTIDRKNNSITVAAQYADLGISYTMRVRADGVKIYVNIDLDEALPLQWIDKVGFNLELFPAAYFGKTWHLDNKSGIFPRQANSPARLAGNATVQSPIATGQSLSIAPESALQHLVIESRKGELALYDGREQHNNGWFVVRSVAPAGATKDAIEWVISPKIKNDWVREPVLLHSQVGYHPDQEKTAIIELDPQTKKQGRLDVIKLLPNATTRTMFSGSPKRWGRFLRYDYATLDFSAVAEPGIYYLNYDGQWSTPFSIGADVYANNVWQPTLETFFPVQMCHAEIRDRYRVWHGLCHADDALQAPTSHEHFDGYSQGESTETRYRPYNHIPNVAAGGWHDAGDYDLPTGSEAATVYTLALAQEAFRVPFDQTTVHAGEKLVELGIPDGRPDILQQIEHGARFLLAGYNAIGHAPVGIICPTLEQYTHLGDAATMTDNAVYNASDDVLPAPEFKRGKMDDRWMFTNKDTGLEYRVATALAAASRVLAGYNPDFAQDCFNAAEKIWNTESRRKPVHVENAYVPENVEVQKVLCAVELFKCLKSQKYRTAIINLLPEIQANIGDTGWAVAQVFAELHNDTFDHEFFKALRQHREQQQRNKAANPFGLPYQPRIWGAGWDLLDYGVRQYYLHKAFPELFDAEAIFRVVNFVLGCHPGSNTSFVSGVGAKSLTTAYGANRADFSYIPGGVASGTALIQPDFPELKEPWPFLWQQSEYVIFGAASYIFCVLATNQLLAE